MGITLEVREKRVLPSWQGRNPRTPTRQDHRSKVILGPCVSTLQNVPQRNTSQPRDTHREAAVDVGQGKFSSLGEYHTLLPGQREGEGQPGKFKIYWCPGHQTCPMWYPLGKKVHGSRRKPLSRYTRVLNARRGLIWHPPSGRDDPGGRGNFHWTRMAWMVDPSLNASLIKMDP